MALIYCSNKEFAGLGGLQNSINKLEMELEYNIKLKQSNFMQIQLSIYAIP